MAANPRRKFLLASPRARAERARPYPVIHVLNFRRNGAGELPDSFFAAMGNLRYLAGKNMQIGACAAHGAKRRCLRSFAPTQSLGELTMTGRALLQVPLQLAAALLAGAMIAAGCASHPPAQRAVDVKALAGKWEGHTVARSGHSNPAVFEFFADGRYEVSVSGSGNYVGKVTVVDGKYRFMNETRGIGGTFTLHEGDGVRVLTLLSDDGITGEYRPAK
jgi:hypothetical protein